MKKNTMMRLASFLLIAVLISTSAISGTYAKYVTSDSASDTARVAKWGIDVQVGGDLFGHFYEAKTDTAGNVITATASNSVDSSTSDNVVAPGTKNEKAFAIKISGTPEVSYQVTAKTGTSISGGDANEDIFLGKGYWGVMVAAQGLNAASDVTGLYTTTDDKNYTAATGSYDSSTIYYELHDAVQVTEEKYYPIVWKVTSTDSAAIATTSNIAAIADSMVTNLTATKADVDAKADYTLQWEWPFYKDANTDARDTILGNLQAASRVVFKAEESGNYGEPTADTNYNLNIAFNFEVVVEQTD